MSKIKTWQKWLQACGDVSETEGFPKTNAGKEAQPYLNYNRGIIRGRSEDLNYFRGRCWKQYKKDNKI